MSGRWGLSGVPDGWKRTPWMSHKGSFAGRTPRGYQSPLFGLRFPHLSDMPDRTDQMASAAAATRGPGGIIGGVIWQTDKPTQTVARNYPLPIYAHAPRLQDPGGNFEPASWKHRLRPPDVFPPGASTASPKLIIDEFQVAHYLPALALTVRWGSMARTSSRYIYRQHDLQYIHDALGQCAQSISRTDSIQESWDILTQGLQWTNVITSKTLHFLCRALGFNQDPPVPIDRGVILNYVWPGFRIGIPPAQRPADWEGNTFAAYCRYMTAIATWGQMKQPPWTTTEVESTIYFENC